MRLTLASPYLAISSNRPSTMAAEALSASISTARCFWLRGVGVLLAMSASLQFDVPDLTAKYWPNAIAEPPVSIRRRMPAPADAKPGHEQSPGVAGPLSLTLSPLGRGDGSP